jgi:hypothetical protein
LRARRVAYPSLIIFCIKASVAISNLRVNLPSFAIKQSVSGARANWQKRARWRKKYHCVCYAMVDVYTQKRDKFVRARPLCANLPQSTGHVECIYV